MLEIIPFSINRKIDSVVKYVPIRDELYNKFDRLETQYIPSLFLTNEGSVSHVKFKISIRNNGERILKLRDVALTVISDGKAIATPGQNTLEWKTGMILKNDEYSFVIDGPSKFLINETKLLGITIYDVPTQYDLAGTVTRKDNFEWFYKIDENVTHTFLDSITFKYSYIPVRKEYCNKCNGLGKFETKETCGSCRGSGRISNSSRYSCKGYGFKMKRYLCDVCNGSGLLYFPKSNRTEIKTETTEVWSFSSFKVKIIGTTDAKMWLYDKDTRKYVVRSISGNNYWYTPPEIEYPIIIKCKGKLLQILPKDTDGSRITIIAIDGRSNDPKVIKGTLSKEDYSSMIY